MDTSLFYLYYYYVKKLPTLFIAGSRELSNKRILSLFKRYSSKYSLIWGVYSEEFIKEFENQPQFRTLQKEKLEKFKAVIEKVNPNFANKIEIIEYSQDEEIEIIKKIKPDKVIFIYGSWKIAFHRRPLFEFLEKEKVEFSIKSPFLDEDEARDISKKIIPEVKNFVEKEISQIKKANDDKYFLQVADTMSKQSFDYTWQTGAVLEKEGKIIIKGHNVILPYETHIFHYGSLKEQGLGKFSRAHMHDLNVNDTLHAEMDIVAQALQNNIDMKYSTLYINLMPCPNCARLLCTTGIKKVVCRHEHFGGLAGKLFEEMGIEVKLVSD